MSAELFSPKAKAEAASGITGRKKCSACLAGMLLFGRELSGSEILLSTENKTVRDLFVRLCEHAAGEGCVSVRKTERGGRQPLYIMKINDAERIASVLESAEITLSGERGLGAVPPISDRNFGSFAAGVFMICGSVVNPEKGYHLEFVAPTERLCAELREIFSDKLGAEGKILNRGGSRVLYFKESEQIEDILTLIGAPKSSLEIMNVKIYKDVRNHANRATNCDTANLDRQNRSAQRQIAAIERIMASEGGLSKLPDELRELCELRLKYPETSLSELMNMTDPPLSRSGVNHRFARIEAIAEKTGDKNV